MSIAFLSANRPIATKMFYLAVLIIGVISLVFLKVGLLPSYDIPHLLVLTKYPGASAEEIEENVTSIIEESLSNMDNLKEIYSTSMDGLSIINLEFYWKTDMDFTILKMREKLDRLKWALPEGIERSNILDYNPENKPIMTLVVTGDNDVSKLSSIADKIISKRLNQLSGVANVNISGKVEENVYINVDMNKLENLGLSISELNMQISAFLQTISGGNVRDGELVYSVNFIPEINNVEELKNVFINSKYGYRVRLSEIAQVRCDLKPRTIIAHYNGKNAILLEVIKETGANIVDISKSIRKLISDWNKKNDKIKIDIIDDASIIVKRSLKSVIQSILLGGILAFLSLFWFLKDLRSPVVVALSIPFSLLITFILLFANKLGLNMLSLSGLAIGIGLLVDNSIIVLENIKRLKEQKIANKESVIRGTNEIMKSIIAGTLTTIIVFLPIIYLRGPIAIFFKEQAIVIIFALFSSLLIAITLIPALYAAEKELKKLYKPKFEKPEFKIPEKKWLIPFVAILWIWKFIKAIIKLILKRIIYYAKAGMQKNGALIDKFYEKYLKKILTSNEQFMQTMLEKYESAFHKVMDSPGKYISISVFAFLLALVMLYIVPRKLLPPISTDYFVVNVKYLPGVKISNTEKGIKMIENFVNKEPQVASCYSVIGREYGNNLMGYSLLEKSNLGYIVVKVKNNNKQSIENLVGDVSSFMKINLPGINYSIKSGKDVYGNIFSFSEYSLSIRIQHKDMVILRKIGDELYSELEKISDIKDINYDLDMGRVVYNIVLKEDVLNLFSIDKKDLSRQISKLTGGVFSGSLSSGNDKKDIYIYSFNANKENDKISLRKFLDTRIKLHGRFFRIGDLINLEKKVLPTSINHYSNIKTITFKLKIKNGKDANVVKQVKPLLEQYKNKYEAKYLIMGELTEVRHSFLWLFFAFILSIVLVYILLGMQFESFYLPLIIILAIPFSLIGVALALVLTWTSLNMISFIGIIVLVGIVVNDSIVKIDTIERLRWEEKMGLKEAIFEAGKRRFRPILMTSLTTIVGLIPLSLGLGSGSEMLQPLGITVIGGLVFSTYLTLFVIPAIYYVIEKRKLSFDKDE